MTEFTKDQIISKAFKFHSEGNIVEAAKYYQYFINKGFKSHIVFSNYGAILKSSGKLNEAELSIRKAIKLNPEYAEAHYNLGVVLKNLGKLKEAESSYRKAVELNSNYAIAFCNLGNILRDSGNLKEAELFTRRALEINPDYAIAFCNLGNILNDLGKLKEAESSYRKAIELNPNYAIAYSNLGSISKDLGKLEQSEKSLLQAIKIKPDFGKAYFLLSTLEVTSKQKNWEQYLFSRKILNNQNNINLIDIYFARANILEKKLKYKQSSNMFIKGNTLIRKKYGSNYIHEKNQMQYFYEIWQHIKSKKVRKKNQLTSIFIVGLPRSGKTLTESILSCNKSLLKCGEDSALTRAVDKYLNPKVITNKQDLYQLYVDNLSRVISNESYICSTTPGNYKYTGIIVSQILKSKVIYCFRNPLDHLKELYCRNLMNKFTFKTSIAESAKILLSINKLMENYKKVYNSKIYFLNYDKLVTHPEKEIKSLLDWLGLEYKKEYLHPRLDPTTAISSDKTNGVINKKYLNVWKNYEKLLQPAIEIILNNNKSPNLIY